MEKPIHKLMTVRELAAYLKVQPLRIYILNSQGKLPGLRIGRAIRFDQSEVDKWLRQGKVGYSSAKEDITRKHK